MHIAPRRQWVARALQIGSVLAALTVLLVAAAVVAGWTAFGQRASGERRARMLASPQFRDGHFVNPQPLWNDTWGALPAMLHPDAHASPSEPVPTATGVREALAVPPVTGLRVTWLGHSTLLIEIDGRRVLTDPMFGERASPFSFVGPARWYPPVIALEQLGPIDAVLFSHDHYDHLDRDTVLRMKDWETVFVAPLGVGAHLVYWGVPPARIRDVDWWDRVTIGNVDIVCTPARHASGRQILDKDATLWAGYALIGPTHRAYHSGDTGLFPAMREIGARLGPFDVTMIEVGQYNRAWPDWHIGPEQAVEAHAMVRGKVLLPIHWGLFQLAAHGWTEPIERVTAAARKGGQVVLTPRPGESVEPERPRAAERWWPQLPWKTAAEDPIVSTQVE